jgi:hypothetical protein
MTTRTKLTFHTDLIYKCGGIDKRTIEKFEKVRHISIDDIVWRWLAAKLSEMPPYLAAAKIMEGYFGGVTFLP